MGKMEGGRKSTVWQKESGGKRWSCVWRSGRDGWWREGVGEGAYWTDGGRKFEEDKRMCGRGEFGKDGGEEGRREKRRYWMEERMKEGVGRKREYGKDRGKDGRRRREKGW